MNLKSLPAAASLLIFHQKRRSCSGRNWIQMSHLFLLVSFHQQYRLEVVRRTTWFVGNQEDPTQNPSGPNYHQLSLSNQVLSGFSSCHQSLVSVKSRQSECGRCSFLNSHFYTVLIVRLGKGTKPAQIGLKKDHVSDQNIQFCGLKCSDVSLEIFSFYRSERGSN